MISLCDVFFAQVFHAHEYSIETFDLSVWQIFVDVRGDRVDDIGEKGLLDC